MNKLIETSKNNYLRPLINTGSHFNPYLSREK